MHSAHDEDNARKARDKHRKSVLYHTEKWVGTEHFTTSKKVDAVLSALDNQPDGWANTYMKGSLADLKKELECQVAKLKEIKTRGNLDAIEGLECRTIVIETSCQLLEHPDFPLFDIQDAVEIGLQIKAWALFYTDEEAAADFVPDTKLLELLRQNSLDKWFDVITQQELTMADMPDVTLDELKELGIPLGPRKRIVKLFNKNSTNNQRFTWDSNED